MSAAVRIPMHVTVEEFLDWDSGDGRRWQLVDGELVAMAPTSRTHGAMHGALTVLIGNHLGDGPCSVVIAPGIIPRVNSAYNFRIPDLGVSCTPYESEEHHLSDPVLLIEILSPSNQSATWANVWTYTTLPSVREILIVRTVNIRAELLRRRPEGDWPQNPDIITVGDLTLESIGLTVPLASIYRTTRLAPPK